MSRIIAPLFELSAEKKDLETMRKEWVVLRREVATQPQHCPCGKNGIVELCWVRNVVTNRSLFVGNCCVTFVAEKGYCSRCEIYPVVSHTAHYCRFCGHNRKDAPSGVVEKGVPKFGDPIKGLTYVQAYLRNTSHARYILANPHTWKYNDPHYIQFLRLNEERNSVRRKRMPESLAIE
jgi:hypothetical protein